MHGGSPMQKNNEPPPLVIERLAITVDGCFRGGSMLLGRQTRPRDFPRFRNNCQGVPVLSCGAGCPLEDHRSRL